MRTPYRLGLDIGPKEIGWCILDLAASKEGKPRSSVLEPFAIRAMGVRVFPSGTVPKGQSSPAAVRREARGTRRNRDRYLVRRTRLMGALIRHGLMPECREERKRLETRDPYALRAKGARERIEPFEFGRALFHINQRRGFRSNRKTAAADDESLAMSMAILRLRKHLRDEGFPTLGAFLHERGEKRFRPRPDGDNPGRIAWDFYPDRTMYEEEFEYLWTVQQRHHPQLLGDEAREEIRSLIFHQRPLIPVTRGRCALEPEEERAHKALPLYQEFRILQDLANLKIRYADGRPAERLTPKQRECVFAKLQRQKTMSFDRIRKLLELEKEDGFNLEIETRRKLSGDETGTLLAAGKCFGAQWWDFPPEKQNAIVKRLLEAEDRDALVHLAREEWELDAEAAGTVADTPLPAGVGGLSEKALRNIVPEMRRGKNYADAAAAAGYDHSDRPDGKLLDELPYYAIPLEKHVAFGTGRPDDPEEIRHGKIANPAVHAGLNQLRKLVNALIRRYGKPEEVVLNIARELKQSADERSLHRGLQARRQKQKEAHREQLREMEQDHRQDGLLRMRLWEELNVSDAGDRRCVYTGRLIDRELLFSEEIEVGHILPFSRTLDDSLANKTVAFRRAIRDKGSRSPHEAFHASGDWDGVRRRAANLPVTKSWRFKADAMDRFVSEETLLARLLVDTRYLSRIAKKYMEKICDPDKVWAVPGGLTAMLLREWKLNSLLDTDNYRNRDDFRHCAIGAFAVAVTSRSLILRMTRAASGWAHAGTVATRRDRIMAEMPPPYPRFDAADMKRRVRRITVSHRPDHGTGGKLLGTTAYGLVKDPSRWNGHNLVYRKAVLALTANELERIRDPRLREEFGKIADRYGREGDGLRHAMEEIRNRMGIRRIRLTRRAAPVHEVLHGPEKRFRKAYLSEENHHIDILDVGGKWVGESVSLLAACRNPDAEPWRELHPDARLIMRVHKNDLLLLREGGEERIFVVQQLRPSSNIFALSEHNESGNLQKRHANDGDPFRMLFLSFSRMKEKECRRITVDILGRLHDPWPGTDITHNPPPGRSWTYR